MRTLPDRIPRYSLTFHLLVIRYYAKHVQPLFPVYSQEELASFDTLSPFAILSICAIAALSEKYPYEFFHNVRAHLATAVEMFDPFSHSSLDNVQVRKPFIVTTS